MVDVVHGRDHTSGPGDAPVTVIEYGDFECPNCKQAAPVVALLIKRFAGRVRLVFRHFPLEEVHSHALIAAEAAEVAGNQGKFWEMHDLLFAHQPHFQLAQLRELALSLNLDMHRFAAEMRDHAHVARVREDQASGRRIGVRATPTFYVNGSICDVSFGVDRLERTIAALLP